MNQNTTSFAGARAWARRWDRWIGPLLIAAILGLWIDTRFRASSSDVAMPPKVDMEQERELFLTPGGLYTAADIAANGGRTSSEAFAGFQAKHDRNPQPGDPLCPITGTKANPACAWIVGGREYLFCCPPCVDEWVRIARERPEDIRLPEEFVQPRAP